MPRYHFEIVQTVRYDLEVEADSPEEAEAEVRDNTEDLIASVDGDGSDFQIHYQGGDDDEGLTSERSQGIVRTVAKPRVAN